MIHELRRAWQKVLALDCPYPEPLAVMEGNNPGWIFVDDLDSPRAALVWAYGIQGFYLVGDPHGQVFLDDLAVYTDQVLRPRLRNLGVTWFEISGGEHWDPVIEHIFRGWNLERSQQWVYTLPLAERKSATQWKAAGDSQLRRVDRDLLEDLSVGNRGFLISKLTQFWSSVDEFLKLGFGYVIVDGGAIVSLCCSGLVAGNTHVIDVETDASYRRKGHAEKAGRAFVTECLEKQLQPYWDCMAHNTASAKLAEKLGFTQSHAYTLYSFPLRA